MQQQINLFSALPDPAAVWLSLKRMLLIGITYALILVVFSVGYHFYGSRAATKEQELKAKEKQLLKQINELTTKSEKTDTEKVPKVIEELQNKIKEKEKLLNAFREQKENIAEGFIPYMTGFGNIIPAPVWLTGFYISKSGSGMQLNGISWQPKAIVEFVHKLNSDPVFKGKRFTLQEINKITEKNEESETLETKYSFTIRT